MRCYEHGDDGGWLLKAIIQQRQQERPRTGLHVSTICDDIAKRLEPARYKRGRFDQSQLLIFQELGNAIEEVVARELCQKFSQWVKPAPRADADGIVGSPDGWDESRRTIHEIKATWVSPRDFVSVDRAGRITSESYKFFRYKIQALKYADMWDADRLQFHIVFMVGTGFPPLPTKPRTLTLVPTDEDKAMNSQMLRQHAEDQGWLPLT